MKIVNRTVASLISIRRDEKLKIFRISLAFLPTDFSDLA